MKIKRYTSYNNENVVVFYRPKVTNNEEERIYRIELRGSCDELLSEWNFSVPRTKKEVLQEIPFLEF